MKKFLTLFLLIFLFFTLTVKSIKAKDYYINKVKIDVTINKDGSAYFIEERTFTFDGVYTYGYYDLPKKGFDSLEEFLVYEGDTPFNNDHSEKPQTYYIDDMFSSYRIKFFYYAENETKTFKFIYKLKGVTKVYEDYGEFYWKLQGDGWDKEVKIFESTIKFLSPIPIDKYFVWAHGPLWGEIKKLDERNVFLNVKNVPPNTFVEVRILIPSSYFENVELIKGNILDKVLREEMKWASESNIKRVFAILNFYAPFVGFIFFIILIIYLYLKYGREYKIKKDYIYIREPPSDIKPGVLGFLMSFGVFKDSFLKATIMDLIHQGLINIEEDSSSKRKEILFTLNRENYEKNKENLSEFENILIKNILFDKKDSFTIKDLNKKINKNREKYYYSYNNFKESIEKESKKYDFFDVKSKNVSGCVIFMGIYIPIIGFLLGIFTKNYTYLLWLTILPIYLIMSNRAITRRSYKGKEEYEKWISFKRFLNDFSNLKDYGPKSIVLWEKYLIYGTVLGVSKTVLKALKIVFPQIEDIERGTLILFATKSGFSTLESGINSLNSAIGKIASATSNLYKTSRSSFSSGIGGGGGFSGGGGGGGGGSGGGMG